jgi:xanthine dehydrogenase YagR molybdenum-binding subunit
VAGHEVPVHTDIPHQEVIFLDETDPISSPMKAKGVGEPGICGIGAGHHHHSRGCRGERLKNKLRYLRRASADLKSRQNKEKC